MNGDDSRELRSLANACISGELCSCLFPAFIEAFQQDTGGEPGYEVRLIARRVAKLHAEGGHYAASKVAEILRARADELTDAAIDRAIRAISKWTEANGYPERPPERLP